MRTHCGAADPSESQPEFTMLLSKARSLALPLFKSVEDAIESSDAPPDLFVPAESKS
jgi:hypothetical protein